MTEQTDGLSAYKNVVRRGDEMEITTSAENINIPTRAQAIQYVEPPVAPTETIEQRMDRLTKELDAWCESNGVNIILIAVGKKSRQASSAIDWQPDTHVFTHALAPRSQQ